jgi:ActR/RegA family two-component response regulator
MKRSGSIEAPSLLNGAHVLVAEDNLIISMELESVILDGGAARVDRCRTADDGVILAQADGVSAAVLDVRLGKERIDPVARLLSDRGIPFVFYTGQNDLGAIRAKWPGCKIISKPAQSRMIVQALAELLKG